MRKLAVILLLLLFTSLRVFAAGVTYYVATTGNNANPCTLIAPCKTVQYVVDKALSGDTIYLRAGTYNESVKIVRSGTASLPIILQAYGAELVTINGGGSAALYDPIGTMGWLVTGINFRSNANYVVALDSWGCNGACGGSSNWTFRANKIYGAVWIYGNNVLFENNEVDGSGRGLTNGVTETQPVSFNNHYLGNYVHDFSIRAFWSMQKTHDSLWQGNKARNIGNLCLDLDGFGQVVYRHNAINNDFSDCREAAIELENSFASVVSGNIIVNKDGDGIHVIQYGPFNSGSQQACGTAAGYGDTDLNNNCEGDTSNVILSNNNINITGLGVGIQIYQASDVNVKQNTVKTQFASALFAYKFAYRTLLDGNTFLGPVGAFEPNSLIYVTGSPSRTATPLPTMTRTLAPTLTPSRTVTPLPTVTPSPSVTVTASLTSTPFPTITVTASSTPSVTVTATETETVTETPTPSCSVLFLNAETYEVCLRRIA